MILANLCALLSSIFSLLYYKDAANGNQDE